MSVWVDAAAAALTLIAVVSAAGIIAARRTFYSVFWLAGVGLAVAGFMALLGFTYLAAFHLIVYVGAAASFIAFTLLMLGEEAEAGEEAHDPRKLGLAVLLAAILWFPVAHVVLRHPPLPGSVEWRSVASMLTERLWLPLLITVVGLSAALVEAITLTRGGEGE
ncbi:MAG: NADH-quinone oxidoreductase subunit J [Crenarchaeota archaeon]|nr:NADH-quinone oxidoreductase subunit J [Thermoproteota archaeon]